jgi:uncharacterized protein (TIGR02145 family)
MKKHIPILFLFLALFVSSSLHSQSPLGIPYQAVMRNADGSVLASSETVLTFMIHDVTANGTVVYQESHALTSNAQGLVSCVVGNGVASQGDFANINWGNGAKFLQVMMGTTDLGTQQMLSVPYALHSSSADNALNATNATNAVNAQTAENGFSSVSTTGDTLYMANGSFIIVPGISAANFPPAILGCTDNAACNYNSAATQNDNSCLYTGATCDDGNANTTNDVINGSCVCAGTQTSGSGTGTQLLPGNATCATQNISVTGCGGQTSLTYDGRTYDLVEIGGQCWFADNLATDQYRNGDLIPTGLDTSIWNTTENGAFSFFVNDPANDVTYGKLYNWYTTADSRGLCPSGWHVPTDCEWMYLEGSLGMSTDNQQVTGWRGYDEGAILKSTNHWLFNIGAINTYGFSALPGGYYTGYAAFFAVGREGFWWSTSAYDADKSWLRALEFSLSSVYRINDDKNFGASVRCLRDSELISIQGCTDSLACNYNSGANSDDNSCLYIGNTCDDGDVNTVNDLIGNYGCYKNCQCDGSVVNVDNIVIGQNYQGGKVAYILQPNDSGYVEGEIHGLIASFEDLPGFYKWGCVGIDFLGAESQEIGAGAQNTSDIISSLLYYPLCGDAAKACSDLVLSGYSDWFLPSNYELLKLLENEDAIGCFQNFSYWTSSEDNFQTAIQVNFLDNTWGTGIKESLGAVRAVRYF